LRRTHLLAFTTVALAAVLCGCGTPGPDGPADSYGVDFSLPPHSPTRGAVVFLVDGMNAAVFQEMLEAGELPAFEKYFVRRGLYCPRAVANTPSVTLANLTSVATGVFPGHHGVTGINWFDRNTLVYRDYATIAQKNTLDGDYITPTIYEQFPERSTYSLFFQPHRGATKFFENWTSAGPPFFFGWYHFVDRLSLYRFGEMMDLARRREAMPAVTICYMLSPDFVAYESGLSSEAYRQSLRHSDRQIGRVLGDLERAGLLEETILALVSDHGHMDIARHFDLERFLRENVGLNVARRRLWEETNFEDRLDYYGKYNAVLYGSGDRYWAIQLRKPVGGNGVPEACMPWPHRPSPEDLRRYPTTNRQGACRGDVCDYVCCVDLLKRLIEREEVDAVAYRAGPDRVRVRTKRGEVEFAQLDGRGGEICCRVIDGTDPLGWREALPAEAADGALLGERRWLEITHGTDYPDLPAQLLAYFRGRRAGDIAVFAAPGFDFDTNHKGGHGGLRPADLFVPMALAGPGVPKGQTVAVSRTVDLVPTLLKLLGKPLPAHLDGKPLTD